MSTYVGKSRTIFYTESLPAKLEYFYLLLYSEKYQEALNWYVEVKEDSTSEYSIKWLNDFYREPVQLIENNKTQLLKDLIDKNIKQSLVRLKLDKLTLVNCSSQNYLKNKNLFDGKVYNSSVSTAGGVSYYHQIFSSDLARIKEEIIENHDYKVVQLDNKLEVIIDDKYSFYFVLYESDNVQYDIEEIIENYQGNKDLEYLKSITKRIDFWGDNDNSKVEYINIYMFLLQTVTQRTSSLIYWPRNRTFFDEV